MAAPFPHTCTITRPGTDERPTDTESGQPIGAAPDDVTVYAGRCFFDDSAQGIKREMGGDADVHGKGVLRLPGQAALFDQDADSVSVTANGVVYTGCEILSVSYRRRRVHLVIDLTARPAAA